MNWTIAEVKQKGKDTFKGGYWKCVLVALVITIITGGIGGLSGRFGANAGSLGFNSAESTVEDAADVSDLSGQAANINEAFEEAMGLDEYKELQSTFEELVSSPEFATVMFIFTVVMIFALIIGLVISFFLVLPLMVGCYRFFRQAGENRTYDIGNIGFAFSHSYLNVVKICVLTEVKVFLWTLLFIIPGIIKSYEYRMIPFILGDNPEISSADAFRQTKELMTGNKWHSFLLDLSFIGWMLLAVITCNIAGIFYVYPYIYATEAQLYLTLKGLVYGQGYSTGNTAGTYNGTGYDAGYNADSYNTGYTTSDTPSGYQDVEYRDLGSGNQNPPAGQYTGGDTPAFGDERNRVSGNDKPFNTPY